MTGPTDPALRALLAAQIDHPLPGEPFSDTCILARDVFRILAAAEAAPPTDETLAEIAKAAHAYYDGRYGDAPRPWIDAALAAAEAAPPTDPDIEAHVAAIVEQYGGAFDALAAHDSAEAAPPEDGYDDKVLADYGFKSDGSAEAAPLDVGRLAEAMHIEWDSRLGEPSEPGIVCGDCTESAVRVLRSLAALRSPDTETTDDADDRPIIRDQKHRQRLAANDGPDVLGLRSPDTETAGWVPVPPPLSEHDQAVLRGTPGLTENLIRPLPDTETAGEAG